MYIRRENSDRWYLISFRSSHSGPAELSFCGFTTTFRYKNATVESSIVKEGYSTALMP